MRYAAIFTLYLMIIMLFDLTQNRLKISEELYRNASEVGASASAAATNLLRIIRPEPDSPPRR